MVPAVGAGHSASLNTCGPRCSEKTELGRLPAYLLGDFCSPASAFISINENYKPYFMGRYEHRRKGSLPSACQTPNKNVFPSLPGQGPDRGGLLPMRRALDGVGVHLTDAESFTPTLQALFRLQVAAQLQPWPSQTALLTPVILPRASCTNQDHSCILHHHLSHLDVTPSCSARQDTPSPLLGLPLPSAVLCGEGPRPSSPPTAHTSPGKLPHPAVLQSALCETGLFRKTVNSFV